MTFSGAFKDTAAPTEQDGVPQFVSPTLEEKRATVEDLVSSLVALSSYIHQLYTQAHLIHLNIETPIFLSVHEFLKDQYDAHVEQFDATAEFVRTLDNFMPMCQRGLLTAHKGFKHVKSYEAKDMLMTYLKNLEDLGMRAKDLNAMAREVEAPDVENYMADLVGACFKAAWFLKATLRD